MTANQLRYAELLEAQRANRTKEAETERSNRAKETENERSNRANETETQRSNLAKEYETSRSNRIREIEDMRSHQANEYIGGLNAQTNMLNAAENQRHNRETEAYLTDYYKGIRYDNAYALGETRRHNQAMEEQGWWNIGTRAVTDTLRAIL